ncbi:MAG: VWA domain-containing protein [Planctomycetia bacterium]|nr:VWA domain-containing protein [Planctomycetia bacterium]
MFRLLGKFLGIENLDSIERMDPSLTAPWARHYAPWVVPACLALCALAALFYLRFEARGRRPLRILLAGARALLLCLLLLFLADPVVIIRLTHAPRPWFWVLVDSSDSMAIEDDYPDSERQALDAAVGRALDSAGKGGQSPAKPSRNDYVKSLLTRDDESLFRALSEKYRLKAFRFDRPDGATELTNPALADQTPEPARWAEQLSTAGKVTALGQALEDLAARQSSGNLAGVLVVSDFDQNSGPPAVAAAQKLGVPVFTLAVGAESAVDLAVDLQAPLLLKKAERTGLIATLRSSGLKGTNVTVRLSARSLAETSAAASADPLAIDEKPIRIDADEQTVEFQWTPAETGRFVLAASADPVAGELVTQNNRAEREINVRDDFLRLMFVEFEPTWEWRFIKEVFHRDKLVGQRGFRTFLRSADPAVRRSNELFLPTLTPRRSDFFANDVIFLGDMPGSALGARFCEMTKEFVGKFGGGLVVVAGPRFGPGQLADSPLADMLPVVVDPSSKPREDRPFALQLTPDANAVDFMELGAGDVENRLAWNNLGALPWYQPVSRLHPLGTALAVHPVDKCVDGTTRQPVIALRRYGRGEVVYLGFNETWRLRRKYGEVYYRQFWGQMIHRLGLSHALGSQKRFVVRADRQQYQPDDKVLVSVEAYDANYEPLSADDLPDHALAAELTVPGTSAEERRVQSLSIPQFREGVFETRLSAVSPGEHKLTVKDPVTSEESTVFFQVANVSVERRSAVRNSSLAREIAVATGARSYDLKDVHNLVKDFQPKPRHESSIRVIPLWNNWFTFGVVIALMLGEWIIRKFMNLP